MHNGEKVITTVAALYACASYMIHHIMHRSIPKTRNSGREMHIGVSIELVFTDTVIVSKCSVLKTLVKVDIGRGYDDAHL